ncbi:MAG: type II 3-dehydroquinate dehydratase [Labrys sp. (in: a-proteobacteria)]|jgi:3-dehydroquinate dehydratase-2
MAIVYVLNGPNLNMLGVREPSIYGGLDLAGIEALVRARGEALGFAIEFRQTNHEGQFVDWIHEAYHRKAVGLVLNPGALTHTSIAVHDAIRASGLPAIEVHLSNVFAREAFRHHSYVSPVAKGVICGFGPKGYELALEALAASAAH